MAEISTAISDLVLAVSAFWLARQVLPSSLYFSLGIGLQGLAAAVGVARFGHSRPANWMLNLHQMLSWLTTVLGLALMSAGAHFVQGNSRLSDALILTAALFAISAQFLPADTKTLLTKSLSGFSLLSLLVLMFLYRDWAGVMACVLYIVSGSVIGTKGHWSGIPRVDLLHYGLALANVVFSWAHILTY